MLLPLRSDHPPASPPIGTYSLMVANVVAYFFIAKDWRMPPDMMKHFALSGDHAEPVRMLMGQFLSNNAFGLLLSLWFLYLLGSAVEGWIRTPKFLILYFACGMAGAAVKTALDGGVPGCGMLLGPSAAIAGLVGAGGYLLPHVRYDVWYSFGFLRRRDWYLQDDRDYSGESTWPFWTVGGLFLVVDFLLSLFVAPPAAYIGVLTGAVLGLALPVVLRMMPQTEELHAATATYTNTQDLGLLSPDELRSLAMADPKNTTVLLNWVYVSLKSRWGVSPECLEAFRKDLPAVMDNEPPESVAGVLAALNAGGVDIDSKYRIYVAGLLERKQHNQLAIDTYEAVRRNPASEPEDAQYALFRLGVVYEKGLFNTYGAAQYYKELVDRFPMGSFVGQAQARLSALSRGKP